MIIYGKQVSIYTLINHPDDVENIYLGKRGVLPKELLRKFGDRVKFVQNRWLQSLSKGGNHQGIAIKIEDFNQTNLRDMKSGNFLVVLDTLTDVGNIGAITRTAYALGVDGVIACGVRQLNLSAIVRSSSGALLDMPFLVEKSILNVINELKMANFKIYGTSMSGESLEKMEFREKRVLILGSEGRGISKRVRDRVDEVLSIEMKREFDSLNVSAAAAIIIYRMGYGIK
jgi:23S rRNA (guanosine2251-2'-O)-methyltransferase